MGVLLTGAAGFIGSHVADRLVDGGEDVVGLDSFDDFYPRIRKERNLAGLIGRPGFSLVEGDVRDATLLAGLPGDVDAVVHMAARAGVRPSIQAPRLYHDVNVGGTLNLLERARERGIRTFVFASSSSVYGESDRQPFSEDDPADRPISPYAATKRAGELLCHTWHNLHGLDVVCLRLFTAYGPRQRPDLAVHKFARLMADGRPVPVYGDGTTARDYTYVDDIVSGVVAALGWLRSRPGTYEIANLGRGGTVALADMVRILGEELGVDPVIDRLPEQPGDVSRTWADVSKARRLFGYHPSTDFRTGIRRFVEWFRADREAP